MNNKANHSTVKMFNTNETGIEVVTCLLMFAVLQDDAKHYEICLKSPDVTYIICVSEAQFPELFHNHITLNPDVDVEVNLTYLLTPKEIIVAKIELVKSLSDTQATHEIIRLDEFTEVHESQLLSVKAHVSNIYHLLSIHDYDLGQEVMISITSWEFPSVFEAYNGRVNVPIMVTYEDTPSGLKVTNIKYK